MNETTDNQDTLPLGDGSERSSLRRLARLPRGGGGGGHTCHAEDCNVPVPPKLLMCLKHWRRVPRTIQREIWRHYRPGQEVDKRPTPEYLAVMKRAIDAVAGREPSDQALRPDEKAGELQ